MQPPTASASRRAHVLPLTRQESLRSARAQPRPARFPRRRRQPLTHTRVLAKRRVQALLTWTPLRGTMSGQAAENEFGKLCDHSIEEGFNVRRPKSSRIHICPYFFALKTGIWLYVVITSCYSSRYDTNFYSCQS